LKSWERLILSGFLKAIGRDLLDQAETRVMEIHSLMSAYRPGSDIYNSNVNAGKQKTSVSQGLRENLIKA